MHYQRLYYMDATRVFAMILVLALHCSLSFLPVFIPLWPIQDSKATELFSLFAIFAHLTTMPLFFFISGFFSSSLYQRFGLSGFGKNRLIRIGIPFITAFFLLFFLHTFIAIFNIVGTLVRAGQSITSATIFNQLLTITSWQKFYNDIAYFWFLYYILLLDTISFILLSIKHAIRNENAWKPRHFLWLTPIIFASFAAILGYLDPSIMLSNSWQLTTPTQLIPQFGMLLYYGLFFIAGWIFNLQRHFISILSKFTWIILPLAIFLFIPANIVLERFAPQQHHPHYAIFKFISLYTNPISSWLMIGSILGIMYRFANQPNFKIRYLADASYWLYLSQIPLVAYLQIYFIDKDLPALLKFTLILIASLSLLLASYQYMVRYTVIGKTLNGAREKTLST